MTKVIARIKGGLGNQLFCYAAARRLALANQADLVIDHVTGFLRDRVYRRQYLLDHFTVPVRKATPAERLEPMERYRRGLAKYLSRKRPFPERKYLEQEGIAFDPRLLEYRPAAGTVILDGLWQSEGYFKDVERQIREDLRLIPPQDAANREYAARIASGNSVCLHVRRFDNGNGASTHNLDHSYYLKAMAYLEERVTDPHFFLFSDDVDWARALLNLSEGKLTCVGHNVGDENAYADLWLMTRCRHMITANSTFSWWAAWLGESAQKLILTPADRIDGTAMAWGFDGLIPQRWTRI